MKAATIASVAILFGASLVTASPLARRDAAQIQASVTRLAGEATTAAEGTGACAAPCSAWLKASTICTQSANGDQGKIVSCACESSALSAMSTCATYDLSAGGATATGGTSAAKTAAPLASGSAGNTTQPTFDSGNGAGKFGVSLVALGLVGVAGLV
ncbi:RHTO0S21e02168g1_1 [Rhodotorula toruloides]|uniref:RHTO0S21e02168g1_1 n=1 Tax=Rhodotorula toruloides TaxID=5286 RepID=A0A061BG23_RHOTO|nr:RHTO0S21e02168g1_1 [Rhodotorula toruloides]